MDDAKHFVHFSDAWSDVRDRDEDFQKSVIEVVTGPSHFKQVLQQVTDLPEAEDASPGEE